MESATLEHFHTSSLDILGQVVERILRIPIDLTDNVVFCQSELLVYRAAHMGSEWADQF